LLDFWDSGPFPFYLALIQTRLGPVSIPDPATTSYPTHKSCCSITAGRKEMTNNNKPAPHNAAPQWPRPSRCASTATAVSSLRRARHPGRRGACRIAAVWLLEAARRFVALGRAAGASGQRGKSPKKFSNVHKYRSEGTIKRLLVSCETSAYGSRDAVTDRFQFYSETHEDG
jgi:hypothetical protein